MGIPLLGGESASVKIIACALMFYVLSWRVTLLPILYILLPHVNCALAYPTTPVHITTRIGLHFTFFSSPSFVFVSSPSPLPLFFSFFSTFNIHLDQDGHTVSAIKTEKGEAETSAPESAPEFPATSSAAQLADLSALKLAALDAHLVAEIVEREARPNSYHSALPNLETC